MAQMRLMGAVADTSTGPATPSRAGAPQSDYKALVCLFLAGGNDANNLVVPTDTSTYAAYAAGRGVLAIPQTSLLAIKPKTSDGRTWGMHPGLSEMKALFDQGKFAVMANVGTLAQPLTKALYNSRPDMRPLQLFSHNDQQVEWQTSVANKPFTEVATGWGGRVADLTNAMNTNNRISMSITLNGQNTFQVGKTVSQYAVGQGGAIALTGEGTGTSVNGLRTAALKDALVMQNPNLFETAFGGFTGGAINTSALIASAVSGTSPVQSHFSAVPSTSLAQQLHMVARLINSQASLNLKRQIFFVRIGGFDLHDNQVVIGNTVSGAHTNLLRDISQSLNAFNNALVQLGAQNQVTVFTASDFGRTYDTNGDGSDHGWGSHHFMMGGAVNGGDIYGRMPDFSINGPDDTGRGRWIPSTSVDQYSATLAKWFRVSPTNIPVIFPNVGRFDTADLGFMGA